MDRYSLIHSNINKDNYGIARKINVSSTKTHFNPEFPSEGEKQQIIICSGCEQEVTVKVLPNSQNVQGKKRNIFLVKTIPILLLEIVLFIFFRTENYVGLQIITIIVSVLSFFVILGYIAEGFPIVEVIDGPEETSHGIYKE